MDDVLKFVLSGLFVFCFAVAGYYAYKFLNKRIVESRTGWELLAYSLSLIAINVVLFFWQPGSIVQALFFPHKLMPARWNDFRNY